MIKIDTFSDFNIIENYFFETLKKNKNIISDQDIVNIPFKYLIIIKTSLLSKTVDLSKSLKANKEIW